MTAEQQTNLEFLVHLLNSPSEALCMLYQVYKEQTLSSSTVFLWHIRFKEGHENVEDDLRCGRPSTNGNETNVELVKKMVCGDCQLTVQLISDEIRLKRNSNQQIITNDLEEHKVYADSAKMIPHLGSSLTSSHPLLNLLCQRKTAELDKVCSL